MKVSIIAAIGKNRELGKNNKLLWHIKEDLQRFKSLTAGHPIIMGRKTWESLPFKPLPNRFNIVVSRQGNRSEKEATVVSSLEMALDLGRRYENDSLKGEKSEIFIIGGGQIYKQAIEKGLVDKLYLTIVDATFDADTYFPDYSDFKKVISEELHEDGGYRYKFIELER